MWETIGASLRLIRENPLALIAPIAIMQVFSVVQALLVDGATAEDERLRVELSIALGLLGTLLSSLGAGATIFIVAALRWDKVLSPGEAFTALFQRLAPWLATTVFTWLLFLPTAHGVWELPERPALGFPLVFGWLVPMLYLTLRFGIGQEILLLEGRGAVEALRQSWRVMNGYMLRLLGIVIVEGVVASALGFAVTFPLVASDSPSAVVTIVNHLITIPVAVFGAVAVTLYYLRMRETSPVGQTNPQPEPAPGGGW
ncbi:MAG: hypothetical protein F4052_03545 [Dehalococcoidia bacterium]|nr:hypothetical protein [Dehalococcoidia bacterium]